MKFDKWRIVMFSNLLRINVKRYQIILFSCLSEIFLLAA